MPLRAYIFTVHVHTYMLCCNMSKKCFQQLSSGLNFAACNLLKAMELVAALLSCSHTNSTVVVLNRWVQPCSQLCSSCRSLTSASLHVSTPHSLQTPPRCKAADPYLHPLITASHARFDHTSCSAKPWRKIRSAQAFCLGMAFASFTGC